LQQTVLAHIIELVLDDDAMEKLEKKYLCTK